MSFTLDKVVPWGRSFDEYVAMFTLSGEDLEKRFLGCGDGPASFNSTLTGRGGKIISVDPIYRFDADEIRNRIDKTYDEIMQQTGKNRYEFVWRHITSLEELGRVRMDAMNTFLSDYETGRRKGRYLDASLPNLPFDEGGFDLALCSHFLFLYSEQLSVDFHINSIEELCRVATEARIFPLLELGAKTSRHLETVLARLGEKDYWIRVEKVPYEFQKGGDKMLRIRSL